jgi:hypothetical protein
VLLQRFFAILVFLLFFFFKSTYIYDVYYYCGERLTNSNEDQRYTDPSPSLHITSNWSRHITHYFTVSGSVEYTYFYAGNCYQHTSWLSRYCPDLRNFLWISGLKLSLLHLTASSNATISLSGSVKYELFGQ